MNIFEAASVNAIRFASINGELTTEQLWKVPLTSRTGFDLDTIARTVNSELKELSEESFVQTKQNAKATIATLKLDVVKHIIGVKLAEDANKQLIVQRKKERDQLLEILATKKNESLQSLSIEELEQRLNVLESHQ